MAGSTNRHACSVCGRSAPEARLIPVGLVRPQIAAFLDERHPDWRGTGYVCTEDLARLRREYVEDMLVKERGELTRLDASVLESIAGNELVSANIHEHYAEHASFGDRVADRVAAFGGSWTFIIAFGVIIMMWIAFNALALFAADRFDPYPYILLNLMLSCVAALQAPLIMMSQRRQEAKDRLRAENDYRVNLKAELEIRHLHEKLDHLLLHQWERLAEIQQVQIELMEDLAKGRKR